VRADDVCKAGYGEATVCVENDGGGGFVGRCADYAASEEVVEELGFAGARFEGRELD